MSKFCTNCGSQLDDAAQFCVNCGTPVQNNAQPVQNTAAQNTNQNMGYVQQPEQNYQMNNNGAAYQNGQQQYQNFNGGYNGMPAQAGYGAAPAAKKPVNKKLFIVGGILLVLIVAVAVILGVIFSGGNYKTPIDNLVKIMEKGDGKAMSDLIPKSYKEMLEAYNSLTSGSYDDYMNECAMSVHADLIEDFGSDIKVKYEIVSKEKLTDSDLESISNYYSYGTGKYSKVKVTEGYDLKIVFMVSGSIDSDTETEHFTVAKVDGKWVLGDVADLLD